MVDLTFPIAAVFFASLVGSAHCAGMCGGFVALCSGSAQNRISAQLAYNFGRLVTYFLLGLVAGLVGRSINMASAFIGLQQGAAFLLGFWMVFFGLRSLIGAKTSIFSFGAFAHFSRIRKLFSGILNSIRKRSSLLGAFSIGLLSTLLPCGWLYSFAAVAASSGSPLKGALIMAVFWVGTLPVMVSLGTVVNSFSFKLRHYLPKLTSILIVVAGIVSILGHYEMLPFHTHHHHSLKQE